LFIIYCTICFIIFYAYFHNEKITYNSIVNNIKQKNFTAGGYFWKRNPLGESPKTIPVMSEYKGYEIRKELVNDEPILMIDNNGNVINQFNSIYEIPNKIATSFDKVEIYKSATDTKKPYKNYKWIFVKDY
jgi:hypothetical protein